MGICATSRGSTIGLRMPRIVLLNAIFKRVARISYRLAARVSAALAAEMDCTLTTAELGAIDRVLLWKKAIMTGRDRIRSAARHSSAGAVALYA